MDLPPVTAQDVYKSFQDKPTAYIQIAKAPESRQDRISRLLNKAKINKEKTIDDYMSMDTVEDILEGTDVKYATYEGNGRTNLHELLDTGKPALVLFYTNHPDKDNGTTERDAIIFRKLIEKYGDKINFVCYSVDTNKKAQKSFYDGVASSDKLNGNTLGYPSIVMFSYFDLLRGETLNDNDGILKQIDILRGGPEKNKFIKPCYNNIKGWWIPTNLFMRPNDDGKLVVSRLNNSYKNWKDTKFK